MPPVSLLVYSGGNLVCRPASNRLESGKERKALEINLTTLQLSQVESPRVRFFFFLEGLFLEFFFSVLLR